MASIIGPGRHRGLPAVLRSGAGRSALRIVIPRKNWISYVIKFVVVENCLHGNLLLRSGTGTKKSITPIQPCRSHLFRAKSLCELCGFARENRWGGGSDSVAARPR